MRQVNALITVCFVAVFVLMIASCSKEGPAGPAGATGPAGAAGPTGVAGPTGTANVIYSPWLSVPFTFNTTDSLYEASITVTKLDSSMLAKGELKMYINFGTATAPDVVPLPYFDGGLIIGIDYLLQKISLYSNANASTQTTGGVSQFQYRYILIPGGVSGRSAIDWKNYNEVIKYLKIPQ